MTEPILGPPPNWGFNSRDVPCPSGDWAQIALSPPARFVKFYVLRRGFLDGVPGLVHIGIGCFNSMMKYSKLRALEKK